VAKKDKKWKEEYESIKSEILREKVSTAIKENTGNWKENIEELGFVWFDDDAPDETKEENRAISQNKNQKELIAYFNGDIELTDSLIEIFILEVEVDEPNYPLFRKYFKSANNNLLNLLKSGLNILPANQTLLSGISYYNENKGILSQIIPIYIKACEVEQDLKEFKQLSIDFINSTYPQDYDAISELKSIFGNDEDKLAILNEITTLIHSQNDEIIKF